MTYLTVPDLKTLLRDNNVAAPPKAKRGDLTALCVQHSLLTEQQALVTRNEKSTRRAWLTAALASVGCELRTDSRLCDNYIENGYGSPEDIAATMAEMKFYYNHTDYKTILDKIHEEAEEDYEAECGDDSDEDFGYRRDFKPRFRDFYDPYEASDEAKTIAIKRWLEQQPNIEAAILRPELPYTLIRSILYRTAHKHYNSWLRSRYVKASHRYGNQIADKWLREEATLENTNIAVFASKFGALMAAENKVQTDKIRARNQVNAWLGDLVDTSFGNGSVVAPERARARKAAFVERSFVDAIGSAADTCHSPVLLDKHLKGAWKCGHCHYKGAASGLWSHSVSKHAAKNITDVNGKSYFV